MQTLVKEWDSYDATTYTDSLAAHGNTNGGISIIVTTGPPSDHRVHRQCCIPAGKWCSSLRAEDKAIRMALKLVQKDVSLHTLYIISDRMSTLQCLQNLHPSQQVANSDKNEILYALVLPIERGCHHTFTWCHSLSEVHSNELANMAAKERTTVEKEEENQNTLSGPRLHLHADEHHKQIMGGDQSPSRMENSRHQAYPERREELTEDGLP